MVSRFAKNASQTSCVNERSCEVFRELRRDELDPRTYWRVFSS